MGHELSITYELSFVISLSSVDSSSYNGHYTPVNDEVDRKALISQGIHANRSGKFNGGESFWSRFSRGKLGLNF